MSANLNYSPNSSEQLNLTAGVPYQIVIEWAQRSRSGITTPVDTAEGHDSNYPCSNLST